MKCCKNVFAAIILMVLGQQLFAQQTTTVAGGNAYGSGGSVSYTLGQMAYATQSGSNGKVSQGVQQPYEISVLSISTNDIIAIALTAYPNPTQDFLTLNVQNYDTKSISYQLYNLSGMLLENQKLKTSETIIPMRDYPTAVYILNITEQNKILKTFQIIKN